MSKTTTTQRGVPILTALVRTAIILAVLSPCEFCRATEAGSLLKFPDLLPLQEPWIQHLSIKDNILFGSTCDDERYNNVVYACALTDDFKLFPAGDMTEVGENGVNLSGGQKARISLARAVYQVRCSYIRFESEKRVTFLIASSLIFVILLGPFPVRYPNVRTGFRVF